LGAGHHGGNVTPVWHDLSDSLDGVNMFHEMRAGARPLLMVHGIGPGTSGRTNFGPLLDRLPRHFALHVIDLAGFGNSGRKALRPYFDVPIWLRQISQAIARVVSIHGRPPVLIGNSVGGALVLKTAACKTTIERVIAIGTPALPEASEALRHFWRAPRDEAALAAAMRPMTAQMHPPPAHLVAERYKVFAGDYPAYFSAMLAEPELCLSEAILTAAEAANIRSHVTLIHGRQDRACRAEPVMSTLLPMLPTADLKLLGNCGHNVIFERCEDVLATIERLEGTDAL
jgi:pimeloyl-ACP methyl ester carboxylesterase